MAERTSGILTRCSLRQDPSPWRHPPLWEFISPASFPRLTNPPVGKLLPPLHSTCFWWSCQAEGPALLSVTRARAAYGGQSFADRGEGEGTEMVRAGATPETHQESLRCFLPFPSLGLGGEASVLPVKAFSLKLISQQMTVWLFFTKPGYLISEQRVFQGCRERASGRNTGAFHLWLLRWAAALATTTHTSSPGPVWVGDSYGAWSEGSSALKLGFPGYGPISMAVFHGYF